MGKATMRSSTNSVSSTLNENSYENHLSMESRMREICTSGLTRGRTSAVNGNASHPVAFSLLYWKNNYETLSKLRDERPKSGNHPCNAACRARHAEVTDEGGTAAPHLAPHVDVKTLPRIVISKNL